MPPIPRPKILSEVTVPTGGWQLKLYLTDLVAYDTACTVTMPAGTYFLSWDNQTDDFLATLANAIRTAVNALAAPFSLATAGNKICTIWLSQTNKVRIGFEASVFDNATRRAVKIAWTELDGDDIAKVLGFDHSADDAITTVDNPVFTADWQHAYGWYADDDGQINDVLAEDVSVLNAIQKQAPSGRVKAQEISSRFINRARLQFLSRDITFSNGVGYTETNVTPYERNVGLECWWLLAQQGKRFRFYRDGKNRFTYTDGSVLYGAQDAATNTTSLTDAGVTLDTDPQTYQGRLLVVPQFVLNTFDTDIDLQPPQRFYISSHTATVYTIPQAYGGAAYELDQAATNYYILDQPYQTYVLDLEEMPSFAPEEIEQLDRYSIDLPLLRYT